MCYKPNWNDPRVRSRAIQAYGFVRAVISTTKPRAWSTRYIDRYLGQQTTAISRYLRRLLLITTNHHWSIESHQCKQYIANQNGLDYLRGVLSGESPLRVDENNVFDKNHTTYPIVYDLTKPTTHTFDLVAVDAFCQREFGDQLKHLDFNYEDKSNRLWHPLQNVRKEFKLPLMARAGLTYHYDIRSAAAQLVYQHAQELGQDEYLFAIEQYLKDPQAIRESIAQELDMPVRAVKVIINALYCGARVGHNPEFALSRLLANDSARIQLLKEHSYISQLRDDIKCCWTSIATSMSRTYSPTVRGLRLKPLTSRQKWNRYFELERRVLDGVRAYLTAAGNDHFLEHDGWVTAQPIDQQELIDSIKQTTGYRIELSFFDNNTTTYPIVYDLQGPTL